MLSHERLIHSHDDDDDDDDWQRRNLRACFSQFVRVDLVFVCVYFVVDCASLGHIQQGSISQQRIIKKERVYGRSRRKGTVEEVFSTTTRRGGGT